MTKIVKWEPFREARRIQNLMDRMMGDALLGRSWFDDIDEGIVPVDVYETDENVIVEAAVPGMSKDDINISVTGDMLNIRAEISEDREQKPEEGIQYYLRERSYRRFSRSIRLPVEVEADNADAEYQSGILKLTLPKVEPVKSKTITIKAK